MPTKKKKKKGRGAKARRGQTQGVANGPAATAANERAKKKLDEEAIDSAVTDALRSLPAEATASDGTSCWICLEDGPDENGGQLLRDCSCRGDSSGWAHFGCIVEYAKQKQLEKRRSEEGLHLFHHSAWETCPNCKQHFMGRLALNLALFFTKISTPQQESLVPLQTELIFERMPCLVGIRPLAAALARNQQWEVALDFITEVHEEIMTMISKFDDDYVCSRVLRSIEAEILHDMGTYELYGILNHAIKGNTDRAIANLQSCKNFLESTGSVERARAVEDTILEMKHRLGLLEDEEWETSEVELARKQFERVIKAQGNATGLSVTKCSILIDALVEEGQLIEAYHLLCDMLPVTRRTFGTDHTLTKKVMGPHLHGPIFTRQVLHKDDDARIAEVLSYDDSTDMYSVLSGEKYENGEYRRYPYFAKPRELTFFHGALVVIVGAENEKSRFNGMKGIVQDFSRTSDQAYEGEEKDKCPRYKIEFGGERDKRFMEDFHWDNVRIVFFDVP